MKRLIALLACMTFAATSFGQGSGKALPPDLAVVPGDAFAFVHVKLADIWRNDSLKDVRAILEKAGAQTIAAFDKRFTPAPSSIERITVYFPIPDFMNGGPPEPVFAIAVGKPYDREAFLKQLESPKKHDGKNGAYYTDAENTIGVRFIDDRHFAMGPPAAIQNMTPTATRDGPMSAAIELAMGRRPLVIGFNSSAIPQEVPMRLMESLPPRLHPLLAAKTVMLSLDLEGDGHLHARVAYADVKAAEAAEKAIDDAGEWAMQEIGDLRKQLTARVVGDGKTPKLEDFPEAAASLMGLGALQHAEDILKTKPIKRTRESLTATVPLPPHFKTAIGTAAMAGTMMAPAVGKIRESAVRAQGQNNLKQIGLAMHNYHDVNNGLPPAAIVDKKGKPLLSWRVSILPYIEGDAIFKEFKLDEPWDSDHNKKLIEKMPKTFALPSLKANAKPGYTHYRCFHSNGAMFDLIQGVKLAQVTDGLSNTWMVVEADESVPWTKPDDLEFDPKKDLPKLGTFFQGGFNVLYGDGSVRFYKTVPKFAKAMITRDGGEVFSDE